MYVPRVDALLLMITQSSAGSVYPSISVTDGPSYGLQLPLRMACEILDPAYSLANWTCVVQIPVIDCDTRSRATCAVAFDMDRAATEVVAGG